MITYLIVAYLIIGSCIGYIGHSEAEKIHMQYSVFAIMLLFSLFWLPIIIFTALARMLKVV